MENLFVSPLTLAVVAIALALFFDFSNGFHDSANIVATMISSRAISPKWALLIAAGCEFIGAYFLGTAVAATMGKGIVNPSQFSGADGVLIVIASLIAAIGWNLLTWYYGIPSSSSHALIGGLLGAFIFARGFDFSLGSFSLGAGASVIHWPKVIQIILVLIASPFVGGLCGFFFVKFILRLFRHAPPHANTLFKRCQIVSAVGLALSHGTNDAQKTMGIITMTILILGPANFPGWVTEHGLLHDGEGGFVVPHWVILSCSAAIAIGIATGGWTIIKTLGMKLFKVRPVHGFSAQACSAGVLYTTAVLGFPVSTTQIISSSVMGVGAGQQIRAVRWGLIGNIILTWILTIPGSAALGAAAYYVIRVGWNHLSG